MITSEENISSGDEREKKAPIPRDKKAELRVELGRKGIHLLIALVPTLAAIDRSHAALFLMGGVLFYAWAESKRLLGFSTPLVSPITRAVLRPREEGRFALAPVTLGLGALLAIIIFPPAYAAAAVYVLAFGDSAGALVGTFFGRLRPAFLFGKSVEGALACFAASAAAAFFTLGDWKPALAASVAGLVIDVLPLKDFDNLLMPLAVGLAASFFGG